MANQRFLTGLFGRGIQASRSPRMHEREADAQGLRLIYTLFDFAELGYSERDLKRLLEAVELAGFAGINVTHPYKQSILKHLDELSIEAEKIGAANTVAFRAGRRIGYNTDASGFEAAFRHSLDDVSSNHVIQIGAGGAGSATAYALLNLGVQRLTIHDRDAERSRALIDKMSKHFDPGRVSYCMNVEQSLAEADGVVNATPIGMAEYPGMSIPAGCLRKALWVAEIVYFPLETALLQAACAKGCRVMDGSGMAVHQAAGAFEIFTGVPANAQRMARTFLEFDG
jgi:shikimate dehydrogenase